MQRPGGTCLHGLCARGLESGILIPHPCAGHLCASPVLLRIQVCLSQACSLGTKHHCTAVPQVHISVVYGGDLARGPHGNLSVRVQPSESATTILVAHMCDGKGWGVAGPVGSDGQAGGGGGEDGGGEEGGDGGSGLLGRLWGWARGGGAGVTSTEEGEAGGEEDWRAAGPRFCHPVRDAGAGGRGRCGVLNGGGVPVAAVHMWDMVGHAWGGMRGQGFRLLGVGAQLRGW